MAQNRQYLETCGDWLPESACYVAPFYEKASQGDWDLLQKLELATSQSGLF